jgi:hypothetical protein
VKNVAAGFEAKPTETVTVVFEAKPPETVATSFEAKPTKTVRVFFRPNHSQTVTIGFEAQTDEKSSDHSQTVDLGFKAQSKNPRSSSPRARCRPHTVPPDLSATEYPTCATIPGPLHQVSYFCHDPRRCTPCRTCHLHTKRQANTILQTKQR